MRVRAVLLALVCAACGSAATDQATQQTSGDGDSRGKRQTLLNTGAGTGCADWSLLNYLLYYYLIQAQTTEGAQIQHQQTDQMAAALLKLRRVRRTDPLPTLLSQPAGQAAIITLLQKVTEGDTGQLLLLLSDIRDHGRMATLSATQGLGPVAGPGLGLGQQRPAFGAAPGPQPGLGGPFAAQGVQPIGGGGQQFGPLGGAAAQPGLTGRQASGLRSLFGPNTAAAEADGFEVGPQAQAQTSEQLAQPDGVSQAAAPSLPKPPPTSAPTPAPTTRPPSTTPTTPPPTKPSPRTTRQPTTRKPSTTRKPPTTPKRRLPLPPPRPRPRAPPQPRPAVVRSRILAPSTSYHVTKSTLVTTILLKKTKTVPAVRGDTPTSVQHVHTVTHVLTATGLQTSTIVVTPTLVISAGTTRTVYGGRPPPGASGRARRRRRREAVQPALQPSAPDPREGRERRAAAGSDRTPQLPPPPATAEA